MAQQQVGGGTEPRDHRVRNEGHGEKLTKYNVEQLGDIPLERNDGTMRVLVSQMGGCASLERQEIKIAVTERLIH